MEMKQQKPRRVFRPEQKFEIIKDIESYPTLKEGLAKYGLSHSVYGKWKRKLMVGVRATLRNTKPLKSLDVKRLEEENRKLKEVVLNQSLEITRFKKEMSLD